MKILLGCPLASRSNRLHVLVRGVTIASLLIVAQPSASGADVARGRALYENHCIVCHTSKVHRREPRVASDPVQLRAIVEKWQVEQGLRWSREDIEDVVGYLTLTYYKY